MKSSRAILGIVLLTLIAALETYSHWGVAPWLFGALFVSFWFGALFLKEERQKRAYRAQAVLCAICGFAFAALQPLRSFIVVAAVFGHEIADRSELVAVVVLLIIALFLTHFFEVLIAELQRLSEPRR